MKKLITVFFFLCVCFHFTKGNPDGKSSVDEEIAFPGATGWAATTKGGRDGKVIKVTNLNKDGEGSLKAALETEGPRIIVFEVGGVIDMEMDRLRIRNPYVTVLGQTAPDPGITIIRGGIGISTHQVIVQHLRIRPGTGNDPDSKGWEVDGLSTGGGAHHVIIDHCTFTWATDENLSASGPQFQGNNPEEWRKNTSHTITFSNNLIAEALSNAGHGKGEHSKGTLIHDNATEIAVVGNIYASNMDRTPLMKGGVQAAIVNNYIYNPGVMAIHYGLVPTQWKEREHITGEISIVGNILEKGADTRDNLPFCHCMGPAEIYFKDNEVYGEPLNKIITGTCALVDNKPSWSDHIKIMPVSQVREHLLQNAGARPWNRDEIDTRIINEIRAGTNRIIDSEKEVGGYPVVKPVYKKIKLKKWGI